LTALPCQRVVGKVAAMAGRVARCPLARVALGERAARPTMGTQRQEAQPSTLVAVAVALGGIVLRVARAGTTKVPPPPPRAPLEPLAQAGQRVVAVVGPGRLLIPRSLSNTTLAMVGAVAALALSAREATAAVGLVLSTTGPLAALAEAGQAGQTAARLVAHTAEALARWQMWDMSGHRRVTPADRSLQALAATPSVGSVRCGFCGAGVVPILLTRQTYEHLGRF
jgi:hypothetical protein